MEEERETERERDDFNVAIFDCVVVDIMMCSTEFAEADCRIRRIRVNDLAYLPTVVPSTSLCLFPDLPTTTAAPLAPKINDRSR